MRIPTHEQVESICGPVGEKEYTLFCDFIKAVNAEHQANPGKSEDECYRSFHNYLAERYNDTARL